MAELRPTEDQPARAGATVRDLVTSPRFKDNLSRILPTHINSERFATVAMRQLTTIPALLDCTPESVLGAFMEAGSLGLEIGINGECWIIPYKTEATLQIGYLGHMKLAWNSGKVSAIDADVVTREEVEEGRFEWQRGTDGFLHHKPAGDRDITEKTVAFAYGLIWIKGSDRPVWRCIDAKHIKRLRNTGQSANSPAWRNHFGEMAIAKALKLALKWAPKDREQARAITLDDQIDAGVNQDWDVDPDILKQLAGNVAAPAARPKSTPISTLADEGSKSTPIEGAGAPEQSSAGAGPPAKAAPVQDERPAEPEPQREPEPAAEPSRQDEGGLGWD